MNNISKMKRDELLEFLAQLRKKHNDDISIIAINEIEKALTEKKYGLVWEEHQERVDKELETKIPVFTEVEEKELITDKEMPCNFLIEGDNLHSLYLLEKTHKGKVDVIYIDPPYNTGNKDFIYDDHFIVKDDGYKHSKWLSFMSKRLSIAKDLLTETGIIFISIDDNEFASLKMLCDDIFDDRNFLGVYIKQSKVGGGNDSNFIVKEHEYCLCYSKNINYTEKMNISHDEDYLKRYKEKDQKGRYFWDTFARPGLKNPIIYDIEAPDGTIITNGWIRSKKRFEEEYKQGDIRIIQKKDGSWSVQFKQYLNVLGKTPRSFTMDFGGTTEGDKEIKEIFGKKMFNYPKSSKYIKTLLSTVSNKSITVLDFFAGSGTTGQAVLELNQEDDGNRKFILCTNNENNICKEVTYPRLKKIIAGYPFKGNKNITLYEKRFNQSDLRKMNNIWEKIDSIKEENKSKYDKIKTSFRKGIYSVIGVKEYDSNTDGHDANLKYYKTAYINRYEDDDLYISDELMDHIKEMVQLENHIKIDNKKHVIISNEEDISQLITNKDRIDSCKKIYKPSYVFLNTEEFKELNNRNIEIVTIPEYYFASELKEVGEL